MKKKTWEVWESFDTRRLTCCLVWFGPLFLFWCLTWLQISHQAYYTDKLAKATKKTVKQGSVRGQIYDTSGALVEMWENKFLTFTRDRKWRFQEMRETAGKLLQYVDVEKSSRNGKKWITI